LKIVEGMGLDYGTKVVDNEGGNMSWVIKLMAVVTGD